MSSKKMDEVYKFTYKVADVDVTFIRTIGSDELNPKTYQLQFGGNKEHIPFVSKQINDTLENNGYATKHSWDEDSKMLTYRYAKDNSSSIKVTAPSSVAIDEAISAVAEKFSVPDVIQRSIRESKAKNTHRSERVMFSQKTAAAHRVLGTPEDVEIMLRQQFEQAGHEISIGDRVNFDLESDAGKQFLRNIAETLVQRVTERMPQMAAVNVSSTSSRNP